MKKRRRKLLPRFLLFSASIWFFFYFLPGTEISVHYNKEKAQQAQKDIWQKILAVATYIGDLNHAIW